MVETSANGGVSFGMGGRVARAYVPGVVPVRRASLNTLGGSSARGNAMNGVNGVNGSGRRGMGFDGVDEREWKVKGVEEGRVGKKAKKAKAKKARAKATVLVGGKKDSAVVL